LNRIEEVTNYGYKGAATAVKAGYKNVSWYRVGVPDWIKAGNPTQ